MRLTALCTRMRPYAIRIKRLQRDRPRAQFHHAAADAYIALRVHIQHKFRRAAYGFALPHHALQRQRQRRILLRDEPAAQIGGGAAGTEVFAQGAVIE